jgi:hypothetical protein
MSALPYKWWRLFSPRWESDAAPRTTAGSQPATLVVVQWNFATHPEPPRLRWRDRIVRRINSLIME